MRSPNGYGGISYLGKNRRRPYRVRITKHWEYNKETGKSKQVYGILGYYTTLKEAKIALAEYNKDPYDLDVKNITFKEVYDLWSVEGYKKLAEQTVRGYKSAFKLLQQIHDMPVCDIRTYHMQDILKNLNNKSQSTHSNVKKVIHKVFTYSLEHDIIQKDYSEFLKKEETAEAEGIHFPYTKDEIKLLWDNINTMIPITKLNTVICELYPIDTFLMMIYMGVRPTELLKIKCEDVNLEEHYVVGGIKNDISRNRIIPIHDDIYELVKKRVDEGKTYLISDYKEDKCLTYDGYRSKIFNAVTKKLNLNHLPHDGRHTFATLATECNIPLLYIQRIMGHKEDNITHQVYTHIEPKKLVEEVNKIRFK